jgi:FixJ family two-component response regulator
MKEPKILIIDDEETICDACSQIFTRDGYLVRTCLNGTSGLKEIGSFKPDVVFLDLKMPGMSGMEVLEKIKDRDKTVVPIIITGHGTIESTVESMKKGAFDVLTKPLTVEKLEVVTKKALGKKNISVKDQHIQEEVLDIKDDRYTHTADLVAFVKPLDLPPSLYPFAKCTGWQENMATEQDVRFLILKIRGTVDSYHAIVVKNNMDLEQVEEKIDKDLGIVKLSEVTREKLKELMEKFCSGEFTYFVGQQLNNVKFPHRHR